MQNICLFPYCYLFKDRSQKANDNHIRKISNIFKLTFFNDFHWFSMTFPDKMSFFQANIKFHDFARLVWTIMYCVWLGSDSKHAFINLEKINSRFCSSLEIQVHVYHKSMLKAYFCDKHLPEFLWRFLEHLCTNKSFLVSMTFTQNMISVKHNEMLKEIQVKPHKRLKKTWESFVDFRVNSI